MSSMTASLSTRRNEHKPSCSDPQHVIDFQMELLHALHSNVELTFGPQRHLMEHENKEEIEHVAQDIYCLWDEHQSLLNRIKIIRHLALLSIAMISSLIALTIVAYLLFIHYEIDTQSNHSCSLFALIYALCLIVIVGSPLIYLRLRTYYTALTQKWRNQFVNSMVLYVNTQLSTKHASEPWTFQLVYPVHVQPRRQHPESWCYLRVIANNDHHSSEQKDVKQPVFATSKIYDGEVHLVMDFDIYLQDDRLGFNIVNGKKRTEFKHERAISEVGEFIMNWNSKYNDCWLSISGFLQVLICLVILSIPWLVCGGYITGRETVENKNLDVEIYIIIGVSVVSTAVFVLIAVCSTRCFFWIKKRNFIEKLKTFAEKTLAVKYPEYAYSIISPQREDKIWCQLRISDHVLKCRTDDVVLHTTYNAKTSVSIRNRSLGSFTHYTATSPLLQ